MTTAPTPDVTVTPAPDTAAAGDVVDAAVYPPQPPMERAASAATLAMAEAHKLGWRARVAGRPPPAPDPTDVSVAAARAGWHACDVAAGAGIDITKADPFTIGEELAARVGALISMARGIAVLDRVLDGSVSALRFYESEAWGPTRAAQIRGTDDGRRATLAVGELHKLAPFARAFRGGSQ